MRTLLCFFLLASYVTAYGQLRSPHARAADAAGRISHETLATSGASRPYVGDQSPEKILNDNPGIVANLAKLLPQHMTPQQACTGFKRTDDCVAAIYAARHLEIPFAELRAKLTGENRRNLRDAIREFKPAVDAKAEAKKADKLAVRDLSEARAL